MPPTLNLSLIDVGDQLRNLILDETKVSNLFALSRFTNLERLRIRSGVTGLEYPHRTEPHLHLIEPLILPHLESLSLIGLTPDSDVRHLSGVPALRYLELSGRCRLDPLPLFERVEYLRLADFEIESFSFLSQFPRLRVLKLKAVGSLPGTELVKQLKQSQIEQVEVEYWPFGKWYQENYDVLHAAGFTRPIPSW